MLRKYFSQNTTGNSQLAKMHTATEELIPHPWCSLPLLLIELVDGWQTTFSVLLPPSGLECTSVKQRILSTHMTNKHFFGESL